MQLFGAADEVRKQVNGNVVSYVVNRNINYTNICYFKCQFCAFSKGKLSENLRGRPYDLSNDEIQRRVKEAWDRGATEVCMQGGIPSGIHWSEVRRHFECCKECCAGYAHSCVLPAGSVAGVLQRRIDHLKGYLQELKEAGTWNTTGYGG